MGKSGYNQVDDNVDSRNNDFGSDENDDDPFLTALALLRRDRGMETYKDLTMSSRSLLSQHSE
jgi:hypothetical protein